MSTEILVFATHNLNKAKELQALVGNKFSIQTLSDIGCHEDIPETGTTLIENARIKSQYVFNKYGLNCFADDTGLEVLALNGAPGVYSARYAGESKNDNANMDLLIKELHDKKDRSAQFRTVISCIINGAENIFEGILKGEITDEKKGQNGFGYDPIFKPLGYQKTLAEIDIHEKNAISHRAMAFKKLLTFLNPTEG